MIIALLAFSFGVCSRAASAMLWSAILRPILGPYQDRLAKPPAKGTPMELELTEDKMHLLGAKNLVLQPFLWV
jgi:hypothetical protein